MKNSTSRLKPAGLLACAIVALSAASFSMATTASASTEDNTSRPAAATPDSQQRVKKSMHRRGEARHHGRHYRQHLRNAALIVPGYGPVPRDVVDTLSLSTEQMALVEDAKSYIEEQRQQRRELFKEKKRDDSADTVVDPHAALKRQEERFGAMQAVRAESMHKWLAVWDSLDSRQQQILSDYIIKRDQERAQRMADHRAKREARRAKKE